MHAAAACIKGVTFKSILTRTDFESPLTRAPQPPDVEARLTALKVAAQAEVDRLRNKLDSVGAHNSTLQQQLEHAQALV